LAEKLVRDLTELTGKRYREGDLVDKETQRLLAEYYSIPAEEERVIDAEPRYCGGGGMVVV
jgi:hypothetical protein